MKKYKIPYEKKRNMMGYVFVLPWIIGFIAFFLNPFIKSIIFSFQTLTVGTEGIEAANVGLKNYKFLFLTDPNFTRDIITTSLGLVQQVFVITFFSIFIALILNQKFKGRSLVRAFFFLPVIITSGVVLEFVQTQIFSSGMGSSEVFLFQSTQLRDTLMAAGFPMEIISWFTIFVDRVFTYTWRSGVQIVLLLAGLQSIPRMYYEAAQVEGSTPWDSFWFITVPLLSPVIYLTVVYTIIDGFTDYGNVVLRGILNSFKALQYGLGTAQAWVYFSVVAVVLLITYIIIGRKIFYVVE